MKFLLLVCVLLLAAGCGIKLRKDVRGGLPESLARRRSQNLSDVRYDLSLDMRGAEIRGRLTVRFFLEADDEDVVLDFKAPKKAILASSRPYRFRDGHLAFKARAGAGEITLAFLVPPASLHREKDLIYTLFVPDRASETFPCFDQPDLKARLTLALEHPPEWKAVSNAPLLLREAGLTRFAETSPLPPYLFAFAAGAFRTLDGEALGRSFTAYYPESEAEKSGGNASDVFQLHARALAWLEDYTRIPYPFAKFDFVLLPAFPFSGMEHPGAVFYRSDSIFLGENPTQEERLKRASLIAHETAHIWFGDLVTMSWFDDVWTKESFANLMADKIVAPLFPEVDFNLRLITQHAARAYAVDRSAGTHPLYQPLENLEEASQLYGPVIYHKSPFVLRQLELQIGEEAFREGLRRHLKRRAFANATWPQLLENLEQASGRDLKEFSRAWVLGEGRSVIEASMESEGGKVSGLRLTQTGGVRPQTVKVALGSKKLLTARLDAESVRVGEAEGEDVPDFVFPNASGEGYGYFKLDPAGRERVMELMGRLEPPVLRAALWESLYEAVLEGDLAAPRFVDAAIGALAVEEDELLVDCLVGKPSGYDAGKIGRLTDVFWTFLTERERAEAAPRLEAALLKRLEGPASSLRSTLVKGYRNLASTPEGLRLLEVYWREELSDLKLFAFHLNEEELEETAMTLAVLVPARAEEILAFQALKTSDPTRKERFAFLRDAASADAAVRDAFFKRLKDRRNRTKEPWVLDGLKFLNHPARPGPSVKYIRPALELLQEIKASGDIFFPQGWLTSVLGGHSSSEASAAVEAFLAEKPKLPPRLRRLVLQASDRLARASRLKRLGAPGRTISPAR